MQYLYSALILHKTEQEITEDKISSILKAAGVDVDKARIKSLVAALGEINIEEALASAVMAAPAAAPTSTVGSDSGSSTAPDEDDEEEEEEGEEVEDDGLGSLFG